MATCIQGRTCSARPFEQTFAPAASGLIPKQLLGVETGNFCRARSNGRYRGAPIINSRISERPDSAQLNRSLDALARSVKGAGRAILARRLERPRRHWQRVRRRPKRSSADLSEKPAYGVARPCCRRRTRSAPGRESGTARRVRSRRPWQAPEPSLARPQASAADRQNRSARDQQRRPGSRRAAPDHTCRDTRGMPVHAHDGPERLEPERVGKAAQQLVAPVVMDDGLGDHRAEPGHPVGKPFRHLPTMQWQVGSPGSLCHQSKVTRWCRLNAGNRLRAQPLSRAWSRRRSDRPER
jgi:hypothetical protein